MTTTTLETIRGLLLTQLQTLSADPKPTYSIDGQTVSWAQYLRYLTESIDWCNTQIARLDPVEVHSRGVT